MVGSYLTECNIYLSLLIESTTETCGEKGLAQEKCRVRIDLISLDDTNLITDQVIG